MKPVRKPNVLVAAVDAATMVAVEGVVEIGVTGAAEVEVAVVVIAGTAEIAETAGNPCCLCPARSVLWGQPPMRPKRNFHPLRIFPSRTYVC